MLRKFGISGLYSFGNDFQEISFVSKPRTKIANTKYEFNFNMQQADRPMKSAVFFGQNATGKTNLFLGIEILLSIIRYGFDYVKRKYNLNNVFNKNSQSVSLELEISDNHKSVFTYKIVFDRESIKEEFLMKNNRFLFNFIDKEADFNIKGLASQANQEEQAKQTLKSFFSRTLSNNILYTIQDLNLEDIKNFIFLIHNIKIYMSKTYSKGYLLNFSERQKDYFLQNKENILNIFKLTDRSIDDFDFETFEKDGEKVYRIVFARRDQKYSYQEESEGLKKIVTLATSLYEIAKSGKIIIVDELDSSISTQALIKILNELINSDDNQNGQLLVSSHNVLLFDVSFLSSQQIFLIQKNEALETIVRSYYEYDTKSEKKRAYIDYLKGHYDE